MKYTARGSRVLDGAGNVAAECAGDAAEALAEGIALALNADAEDRADQKWTAGNRAAWSRILTLAARELSGEERSLGAALSELEDARRALRELCDELGCNDWPDDLHIGDVIEKHLARHLHERRDNDESERVRLGEE